jgi:hypothetical protein
LIPDNALFTMNTLFPTKPFAGFLHRPLLRGLVFLFILGTVFTFFLPPIHVRPVNAPHFPEPFRSLSSNPPPQPGSNRHRIKVLQRPIIANPDAGRDKDVWAQRADAVRDAFSHAYNSYVTYASPYDELLPLSKAPRDTYVFSSLSRATGAVDLPSNVPPAYSFNGWALSHVESLDTLWLMGLYEEFDSALAVIANTTFSLPPVSGADLPATWRSYF